MVSDSIINASIPNVSKDFGKKKRANRSAKLKQCKLDARREQWLSQVKNNKGGKEEVGVEFNGAATIETTTGKKGPCYKNLEVRGPSVEEIHHHYSDSESPANSPTSSISGGNDSGNGYTGSSSSSSTSSSSSSSFSSAGCCSGSITEEEEGGGGGSGCGDDGCLDDWEAVADALAAAATDDKQGHNPGSDLSVEKETGFGSEIKSQPSSHGNVEARVEETRLESAGILGRGGCPVNSSRAWRPDDAFRPQSLPNLSKQRSFPVNSERHSSHHAVNPWVRHNVPTSCPICCEDLDFTDSSFLPCACGFRLCLFCHKRIIEGDGRCPGCRKPYASDPVEKESSLTNRLARSCSMFSRV